MKEDGSTTDEATTTTTHTNDDTNDSPLANNEIRVRSNLVIKRLVDNGLNKLTEHSHITVIAKGQAISRAITVVEIIKRRLNGNLHQYNQLGRMAGSTQHWNLINESELVRTDVDSILPAIVIHLSSTPMPELETTTTYQPPTST